LAILLGCTVKELLLRMSSSEIQEWKAYYSIEPFGTVRGDLQAARICEVVAASAGDKNAALDKFVLRFEQPQTANDMKNKLMAFAKMHGD